MSVLFMVLISFISALVLGMLGLMYLFGPAARTIGMAHMVGRPVLLNPRSNRTLEVKKVKRIDAMGCYYIKRGNRTLTYRVDPRHVYILGKKIPATTVLEGFAMNVAPEHAKLAEQVEKGVKKPKLEINGESVDWSALGRQVKEWLGPGHLASIMASAYQANKPLAEEKMTRGTVLKLAGLGTVILIAVIGIYLAKTMGWIG